MTAQTEICGCCKGNGWVLVSGEIDACRQCTRRAEAEYMVVKAIINPPVKLWNETREQELRNLWNDGYTAAEIAALMGVPFTRDAVLGKARRIGLNRRDWPKLKVFKGGKVA